MLASSAVQVTNVAPNGNLPPLAGEHDELRASSRRRSGAAYVIVTGLPSGELSDWLAGQLIPKRGRLRRRLHPAEAIKARTGATAEPQQHARRHEDSSLLAVPVNVFVPFESSWLILKTNSHLAS